MIDQANQLDIEQLPQFYAQEHALSAQRRDLHQRIDHLYLNAPLGVDGAALLDELEALERDLSERRARLHRTIDVLRAKIDLPPWRHDKLDDAA
jgi:hypothetical protein